MSKPRSTKFDVSRRTIVQGGAALGAVAAVAMSPRRVLAQAKPIKIGVTCDASGAFADPGQADQRGIILAIEEANAKGGVLGRKIEYAIEDTESDASAAVRKAQRLIEREQIDFLVGALSSAVAAPLSELGQRHGIVYCNTNSSSDTVTNAKCQRVNFAWDVNVTMLTNAMAELVAKKLGTRWFFLTHDYAFGKSATAAGRELMKRVNAQEVGELLIPQGTRDFSSQLLRIRSAKPDVVMVNLAGVELTAIREQAYEFGAERDAAWVLTQQDFPDLFAVGPKKGFGYFFTTWNHTVDAPGAADFTQRFSKRWSSAPISVPDNVSCNGYIATRELLRAVERAGNSKTHDVVKQLEGHVIKDNFNIHPSTIREWDHAVAQTIYLARTKREQDMKNKFDMVDLVDSIAPEKTAPPRADSKCSMQSYADTPNRGA
jgi:branched-chain amino acid transport system substrate-binding protein